MQPRLKRYKNFIETQFIDSLLWHKEYSLEDLDGCLKEKIELGKFKKIVFTGMGCSAIVSDVIKGFFADQKIPIYIDVINDYDFDVLIDKNDLQDALIIISSYSGHSQEPIHFYHRVKAFAKNIVFLTSGGQLAALGKEENVSIIYWRLRNPDREYPLFHVPQYFSILLDIFYELKVLPTNYQKELTDVAQFLKRQSMDRAEIVAHQLRDKETVFIAPPKWYISLLKLADMHFNEMAMTPAHRNYFHEFTHSEVAVFSDPIHPLAIMMFRDCDQDEYIQRKMDRFSQLITDSKALQNQKITFVEIRMDQKNFFEKFFYTLFFLTHTAFHLGIYCNVTSRELISTAAGNPWYNQKTIEVEKVST